MASRTHFYSQKDQSAEEYLDLSAVHQSKATVYKRDPGQAAVHLRKATVYKK